MKKINVAILFGGRSGEHEVSLTSARNVINALDRKKYNVVLIGIDKEGRWHYQNEANYLINESDPRLIALNKSKVEVLLVPAPAKDNLVCIDGNKTERQHIDVVIPVLHGPYGEDGTVQGLLELAGLPYVGSDVLGSSVGMDKDVMKRLLVQAGIPTPRFLVFHRNDLVENQISFERTKEILGLPLFVKPANLGSSVGISKVSHEKDFDQAIKEAFNYDVKIIIEEAIRGREIECAVLGNEKPQASVPGEIIPTHEFYSYDAKYIDENGASLEIPAKLTEKEIREVQELSIIVFKTLCAKGLGRIDFFLTTDGRFLCNEINTFPGFTKISMYPKLWEKSGIPYSQLLDQLIDLALDRARVKQALKVSR